MLLRCSQYRGIIYNIIEIGRDSVKKIAGQVLAIIVAVCSWMIFVIIMGAIAAMIWPGDQATVPIVYALFLLIVPVCLSVYCGKKFKRAYERKHGNPSPPKNIVCGKGESQSDISSIFENREKIIQYTENGNPYWIEKPLTREEYELKRNAKADFWERKFDLQSVAGIEKIPKSATRDHPCIGIKTVTGQIEYYLSMKAAQYEKSGNEEMALACYKKSNELMAVSEIQYSQNSYTKYPRYLRKLRRFEDARREEEKIHEMFPDNSKVQGGKQEYAKKRNSDINKSLKMLGGDLVHASYVGSCCAQCAKYRERVYSFNGKDKRFPKLPDWLKNETHNCGITIYPFVYGASQFYRFENGKQVKTDPISYSNRPFIDDRTKEEIDNYEKRQIRNEQKNRQKRASEDYDWLWENLPGICPKSLYAYNKIRYAKEEKFEMIKKEAKKHGRTLEE